MSAIYTFGNFQLDAANRQLLREGTPVSLPAKAFDLLLTLVENRGRLVRKDELFSLVWHDQLVEESNLTVHIAAIRKALGETRQNQHFITTVPGYGYRFEGTVGSLDRQAEVIIETQTISRTVIETDRDQSLAIDQGAIALDRVSERDSSKMEMKAPHVSTPPALMGRRNRRVFLAVPFVLLLLVGLGGAAWLYRLRDRTAGDSVAAAPKLALHRFTTAGGVPYRVAISPDGKSIVYLQRFNGKDSLWLGQIETNTSVPIYEQPDLSNVNPAFAPDGNTIYFNVKREDRPQGILVRMSTLGGALTELIPEVESPVTFSPDGRRLAFLRRDSQVKETSIVVADTADGKNEQTLVTRKSPENVSSEGISWSPDGKTIAFGAIKSGGHEEVLTVTVADGSINKIGTREWINVENLVWLPDGQNLAVIAKENIGERLRQIWLVSYPGGAARKITNDLNVFLQNHMSVSANGKLAVVQGVVNAEIWVAPNGDASRARRALQGVTPRYEGVDGLAWTPDGHLLYTAYVGDSQVIWAIDGDGGNPKQLTPGKANTSVGYLNVTSDGRYLVFESNRSGGVEIWRANIDGSDLRQLTSGGNNSLPSLSPDGKWVVYISTVDGKTTLSRISIDGTDAKAITDNPASYPQVSPNGKYIAYTVPSDPQGLRLRIIQFENGEPVKAFTVPKTALKGKQRLRWMPDAKSIIYVDHQGLWRQALDAETPQPVKGFEEFLVRNFAWSFDGKSLAYTTGTSTQEIILMENFK